MNFVLIAEGMGTLSPPIKARLLGLFGCLLLSTALYFSFENTSNFKIRNTFSMFANYAYRNANQRDLLFPERKGRPIKMLYWTDLWGNKKDWGFDSDIEKGCPTLKNACKFTTDRRQYNDSDVVLFHIRSSYAIPKYRQLFQKWVFAIIESPVHTYRSLEKERWLYNITMTYKRASDVQFVYGECQPKHPNTSTAQVKYNYAEGKKHLIAWFVSNCNTQSRREVYVRELAKHIDVHKFGCGGKYSCPRTKSTYCDTELLNHTYKFYISFENSLCAEYVTEKVYRILNLNVVPVVLGYSNYSDILPPYSFVDVRNFSSPKALATYLKMLDINDTEYNKYFAWKETYTCTSMCALHTACNLCRYVQQKRHQKQVADVVQFWGRNTNCIKATYFYNGMISL